MLSKRILFTMSFASALMAVAPVMAQHDHTPGATTAPAQEPERKSDPYLLDTCIVSGEKLGSMGDPVVKVYDGREIRFCCGGCVKKFEANPTTYWEKVDEQIVKRQMPFYPIETCIVSDEKLGGTLGAPVNYVHKNRLVRLGCDGCKKKFLNDSDAFLNKLDEAVIAKQRESYPLETCPVSGGALGSMGDPVEMVYGNRLVKLCCKGCIKKFQKNASTHVAAIEMAWKGRHGKDAAHGSHGSDHSSHGKKQGGQGHRGHEDDKSGG